MVIMIWAEALAMVVAETGHRRYRWLCSDDNPDPDSREDHRRLMVQIATGITPPPTPAPPPPPGDAARPTTTESLALLAAARRCPYRSTDSPCGCSGTKCGIRPPGRQYVSSVECMDCVRRYG